MKNEITAGSIVKMFIQVRGKSVKEVAAELDIPYTTFSGRLNRDSIDIYLLFRLNNLLDMDLNWMANVLEHQRSISSLDPLQIPRMQDTLRSHDLPTVEKAIKRIIKEYPVGIADARNALLKEYHTYYLLDILLPEDVNILVINERSKEKYYCVPTVNKNNRGRRSPFSLIDGREMLDQLIAERKE